MTIAFVVNLRWKSDGCHLACVARKFDSLEGDEALNAAINENVYFTSILEKSEQSFISELKDSEVRRVAAENVLINRAFKDVVVNL